MSYIRSFFAGHQLGGPGPRLVVVVALAAILFVAAGAGMAYISGFHAVWEVLRRPSWPWLVASAGAVIVSLAGYALGYRGISNVERGPDLHGRPLLAVVAAGFGGLLGQGSGALDRYAMKAVGAGDREARARVAALTGMELGSLPWIVCPTAIALWITGVSKPPNSFIVPWALIPPIGFAVGFWVAERWRGQLRERRGWRGRLGTFFDGVHYIWVLISSPIRCSGAFLGMVVFWGASMFSLWAGLAAFGVHLSAGALIICYGTAYLTTQRTAPFGGGGLLITALVPTLWYVGGVSLAAATVGVLAHRFFSLWLFMPFSLAQLPKLRALGSKGALPHPPTTSVRDAAEGRGRPALLH